MASYNVALNTRLRDFLQFKSRQNDIPIDQLEKRVTIEPIRVEGHGLNPRSNAIRRFDQAAFAYGYVVEVREGLSGVQLFGFMSSYAITGTGVNIAEEK